MDRATFNLKQYRFERISANSLDVESGITHEMEMKFVIGFHSDAPEGCDFSISIQLHLNKRNDGDREEVMFVEARGAYGFEEGVAPYPIEDPIERAFAVSLLYGCMRPTLDTIVNNIGFPGLNLPITLPLDIIQSSHPSTADVSTPSDQPG